MTRLVEAAAIQMRVTMDAAANARALAGFLDAAPEGALVVAPEGALSGYAPVPELTTRLDQSATEAARDAIASLCRRRRLHLFVGACVRKGEAWRNATYYLGPAGVPWRYDKINLAQSERGAFTPGDALPVLALNDPAAIVGVQMCREIRYPEQWRLLAEQGAQIFAFVNNAVGSTRGDALWRAHLISRAGETQRFIVGANNAAPDQTCPTIVIDPSGAVLAEAPIGSETMIRARLDLDLISDWVLSQARRDVVPVGRDKKA